MAKVFVTNVAPYNPHGSTNLVLAKARKNLYGTDTARFAGKKLWQSVPKEIKQSIFLDCSCKSCKVISYIVNLGLL